MNVSKLKALFTRTENTLEISENELQDRSPLADDQLEEIVGGKTVFGQPAWYGSSAGRMAL